MNPTNPLNEKELDQLLPKDSKHDELYTKLKNPFLIEKILSEERVKYLHRKFEKLVLDEELTELEVSLIETYIKDPEVKVSYENTTVNFHKALILFNQKKLSLNDYTWLGYMYEKISTKKDDQKSFELYTVSHKNKDYTGTNNLGYFYEKGIGTKMDEQKAFELYQLAYNNKIIYAYFNLAYCYKYGIGTVKDEMKSKQLYEEALKKQKIDIEIFEKERRFVYL